MVTLQGGDCHVAPPPHIDRCGACWLTRPRLHGGNHKDEVVLAAVKLY